LAARDLDLVPVQARDHFRRMEPHEVARLDVDVEVHVTVRVEVNLLQRVRRSVPEDRAFDADVANPVAAQFVDIPKRIDRDRAVGPQRRIAVDRGVAARLVGDRARRRSHVQIVNALQVAAGLEAERIAHRQVDIALEIVERDRFEAAGERL